ncbi:holin family protein [Marivita sp.]|uniref:holin family protein n=1 Tax=Marivita sp. TaxID=2003365 RepID=UPI0025C07CD0|nr:holin family protein [Marivita sp.]
MGLIEQVFSLVFGSGRNLVRDTAEVFRPNAEAQAQRDLDRYGASLAQYAQEFYAPQRGWFDRLMDALNRVPRPAMALGTLGLFVSAMVDPAWFAARMSGLALVPDPLWWLLGAIVSFYFGARHQAKGQEFQRDLVARMASMPARPASQAEPVVDPPGPVHTDGNAALEDWQRHRRSR